MVRSPASTHSQIQLYCPHVFWILNYLYSRATVHPHGGWFGHIIAYLFEEVTHPHHLTGGRTGGGVVIVFKHRHPNQ